jgi:hypothetical protein
MRIRSIEPGSERTLLTVLEDGRRGVFDLSPYLAYDAFTPLADRAQFLKVRNGGYFVESECGADLSADTMEARLRPVPRGDT